MKFTCSKIPLLNALSVSLRASVSKSPIPLLEGLLIEAEDGSIKITGYDLKTGIITNVSAQVERQGGIVIKARLLCEIVRRMPGDEITFDVTSECIAQISSGQSKLEIIGSPSSDYPELPSVEEEYKIEIEGEILKSMISQTNFAVSDNESRPIHTGALFETEEGYLTIVAVDGYRLALRREAFGDNQTPKLSFVVPGAALSEVEKIITDTEKKVHIMLGQKHIMFNIENTILVSRRLEGEFLDYRQAVPEKAAYKFKVDKNDLISSLERVSIIISESLKSPIRCIFDDGIVKLLSATVIGKASDECITDSDGNGLEIGFNNKYFIDALRAAPADDVILELNSGVNPCVISPSDDSNSFIYMILPVRLKAEG